MGAPFSLQLVCVFKLALVMLAGPDRSRVGAPFYIDPLALQFSVNFGMQN